MFRTKQVSGAEDELHIHNWLKLLQDFVSCEPQLVTLEPFARVVHLMVINDVPEQRLVSSSGEGGGGSSMGYNS